VGRYKVKFKAFFERTPLIVAAPEDPAAAGSITVEEVTTADVTLLATTHAGLVQDTAVCLAAIGR